MKYNGFIATLSVVFLIGSFTQDLVQAQSVKPALITKSAVAVPDIEKIGPGFPFEMTGTNHFFVEVKLNGEGPFRLIFDLGAPVTLLSNRAARESKTVPPGRRPSLFMGMSGEGNVKEMQFGEATASDIPVMIFDHPAISAMSDILGKRFDGILGYTFFARYRTTIDYQKKRLWFEPVQDRADNVVAALPDKMLNPRTKTQSREMIARRNWIGMEIHKIQGDRSKAIPPALKIGHIQDQSPAMRAGLQVDDVIVAFGPHWIFSDADLADALSGSESGKPVKLIVKRGEKTITVQVLPEKIF